jgi:hypothetical protein
MYLFSRHMRFEVVAFACRKIVEQFTTVILSVVEEGWAFLIPHSSFLSRYQNLKGSKFAFFSFLLFSDDYQTLFSNYRFRFLNSFSFFPFLFFPSLFTIFEHPKYMLDSLWGKETYFQPFLRGILHVLEYITTRTLCYTLSR